MFDVLVLSQGHGRRHGASKKATMLWIKSHTILIRHRKLIQLAQELRIRRSYAMGHLHSLWHNALEQQEDGDLSSWTDGMIAESSDFPGDAPQWVRLLQKHAFLDGRLLHDWIEYAGPYLIRKYATKQREKLMEIWGKHGLFYGMVTEKIPKGDRKETLDKIRGDEIRKGTKTVCRFAPPGVNEVRDYCASRGNTVDPQGFLDFYSAKGWMVGKNKMVDWRAAVRTWERNGKNDVKGSVLHESEYA